MLSSRSDLTRLYCGFSRCPDLSGETLDWEIELWRIYILQNEVVQNKIMWNRSQKTYSITSKKKFTRLGYILNFAATVHRNWTSSFSDGAACIEPQTWINLWKTPSSNIWSYLIMTFLDFTVIGLTYMNWFVYIHMW